MGKERRKQTRYSTEFGSFLYLCSGRDGRRLSVPLECRVVDFSRLGVGIISKKIFVDNQHFFYAALDSEEVFLCIELTLPEEAGDANVLIFSGRPVWFDRLLDQELKPFKMGIEFPKKVPDSEWNLLRQYGFIDRKE